MKTKLVIIFLISSLNCKAMHRDLVVHKAFTPPYVSKEELNKQDKDGFTQLHRACADSSTYDIGRLLRQGADHEIRDKQGRVPFEQLCRITASSDARKLFEKYGYYYFSSYTCLDTNLELLLSHNAEHLMRWGEKDEGILVGTENMLLTLFTAFKHWEHKACDTKMIRRTDGIVLKYPTKKEFEKAFGEVAIERAKKVIENRVIENELFVVMQQGGAGVVQELNDDGYWISVKEIAHGTTISENVRAILLPRLNALFKRKILDFAGIGQTGSQVDNNSSLTLLMEYGLDINVLYNNCFEYGGGITALMIALLMEQGVEELLAAGADVNAKGIEDWTPLRIAVRYKKDQYIKLLLDHKVDISTISAPWATQDDYATLAGYIK